MAGGFVPHSVRDFRASPKPPGGMLRRGNSRASGSRDDRSGLLETDGYAFAAFGGVNYDLRPGRFGDGTLSGAIPVADAIRPFRRIPDAKRPTTTATVVCPGCGIVPPVSAKCDNCW